MVVECTDRTPWPPGPDRLHRLRVGGQRADNRGRRGSGATLQCTPGIVHGHVYAMVASLI